jgi:hypothetical protein
MDEEERAAHVEAGRQLERERAVLTGLALEKLGSNLNSGAAQALVRELVAVVGRLEVEATR